MNLPEEGELPSEDLPQKIVPEEKLPQKTMREELPKKTTRTDILKVEKRVIDLELTMAELKETLKAIDVAAISDLKQKIEDLEDMVWVQDAMMIDFKKALDSIQAKATELTITPELQEKISKIESELASLSQKTPPTATEMESLHTKLMELDGGLSAFKTQTEEALRDISDKIRKIEEAQFIKTPGVDFDLLSSKIESVKASVDAISKKKIEMDLKFAEISKKFEIMENRVRESLSEKILDEIRLNKKEIIGTNARIDSIERVTRDLITSLHAVEASVKGFESLERASMLNKEIEEKIERFKFIESEIKRLSSRVEAIYDSIDKRLDRIRDVEKKFPDILVAIENVVKEIDKTKLEILEREKKEDAKKKFEEFESQFEELRKGIGSLSLQIEEYGKRNAELEKTMRVLKPEVLGKMVEEIKATYELRMEEMKASIDKKLMEIAVPNVMETLDIKMKEIVDKIVFLETRLKAVEQMLQETSKPQPIVLE